MPRLGPEKNFLENLLPKTIDFNLLLYQKSGALKNAVKAILTLAKAVQEKNGQLLLVGGSVRDLLLGEVCKDLDVEIYGLKPQEVDELSHQLGNVKDIGKSFGVLKMSFSDEVYLDIALPRIDSKAGRGHKGFAVATDPNLDIKTALARRDFTINSLAFNPLTGEIYDPFGGMNDLKEKRLKITEQQTFADDPLRALRAMQFIGRFDLTLDEESAIMIKKMAPTLKELPKERTLEEWKKLLLKSPRPSKGLKAAMDLDILKELHPEFLPLKDTPQDEKWHPESDVWTHTLMTVDKTAEIARQKDLPADQALTLILSALCHDLGKPLTTKLEKNRYISPEHEQAGYEPTNKFLNTLGVDNQTKEKTIKLVVNHLAPALLYADRERVTDGAIRRLAKRLYPATVYELAILAEADHLSRLIDSENKVSEQFPAGAWLLERAKNLEVENKKPADIIRGRDLLKLGFKPGLIFGEMIKLANQLHDEHNFTKEQILEILQSSSNENEALNKSHTNHGAG